MQDGLSLLELMKALNGIQPEILPSHASLVGSPRSKPATPAGAGFESRSPGASSGNQPAAPSSSPSAPAAAWDGEWVLREHLFRGVSYLVDDRTRCGSENGVCCLDALRRVCCASAPAQHTLPAI
jgi:hypothetical protein